MRKKSENLKDTGSWIGVGTPIGTAVFVSTNELTWIAVGVELSTALAWRKPKNKNE